jgi:hypothetical protein
MTNGDVAFFFNNFKRKCIQIIFNSVHNSKKTPRVSITKISYLMTSNEVGFEVLTAASMKMAIFWVVAPCNLVEVYRRLRGICCRHHHGEDRRRLRKIIAVYFENHMMSINTLLSQNAES